jgi:integrase
VPGLHGRGLKRESIRKTLSTLAQVLDFAKVTPNPARDTTVKLPADDTEEVNPPTAAHVEAAFAAIPAAYRLPVLVLDATGMRVGELEALRWRDVDERDGRWRVSRPRAKTRQGRWVPSRLSSSMRSRRRLRATVISTVKCSQASTRTRSGHRSGGRVRRRGCRHSRRTISAIAAPRCGTVAECRSRRRATGSATPLKFTSVCTRT